MRTDEELYTVAHEACSLDEHPPDVSCGAHRRRAVYDLGRADERKGIQAVIDGLRVALAEAEEACLEAQNERDRLADQYEPVEIPRKFA